jgi:hypothetical protein
LKAKIEGEDDPSLRIGYQEDLEAVKEYLKKNVTVYGQARRTGELEKARRRVGNRINDAKRKLAEGDECIGAHFQGAVKADGTAFVYRPDRDIAWILS